MCTLSSSGTVCIRVIKHYVLSSLNKVVDCSRLHVYSPCMLNDTLSITYFCFMEAASKLQLAIQNGSSSWQQFLQNISDIFQLISLTLPCLSEFITCCHALSTRLDLCLSVNVLPWQPHFYYIRLCSLLHYIDWVHSYPVCLLNSQEVVTPNISCMILVTAV